VRSAIVRTTKMIVTVRIGGTGVTRAKKTTRTASGSGIVDTVVTVRIETASAREVEVAGRMIVIGRDDTVTDMMMRRRRSVRRGDARGRRGS
jgi:imidazolonepropionase-like amidohydrolase